MSDQERDLRNRVELAVKEVLVDVPGEVPERQRVLGDPASMLIRERVVPTHPCDEAADRTPYGRTITLKPQQALGEGVVQVQDGLTIPDDCCEKNWIVTVRPDVIPRFTINDALAGEIMGSIKFKCGGIAHVKTFTLHSTVARRIPLHGHSIEVDLVWAQGLGDSLTASKVHVQVSAVKAENLAVGELYSPHWQRDGAFSPLTVNPRKLANVPQAIFARAGGYVLCAAQGFSIAMGGAAVLYPMLFDKEPGSIVAGDIPVAGGVGPPLTAPNQAFHFEDEFAPEVGFSRAVSFTLSTSPTVYAAPPAGASARIDVKLGD